MTWLKFTADCLVMWAAQAGVGPGYTLETAAVRLATDIAEVRNDGGIPPHVHTVITVLPQPRMLEIRVEGLSVEADPDRTAIREVMNTLFELAIFRTNFCLIGSFFRVLLMRSRRSGAAGPRAERGVRPYQSCGCRVSPQGQLVQRCDWSCPEKW